ncbi:MAG: hypothetical protein IT165_09975 [Bryobacterales bacterium]|nr:hypothetical protein [Bryobacterales bacterium]
MQIDPSTGDLVATGGGQRVQVTRRIHHTPRFSVQFVKSGAAVRYSYGLTNLGGSQHIDLFTMDVFKGSLATSTPHYWWFLGTGDPKITDNQDERLAPVMWGRQAADDDDNGKLRPGTQAGPFVLESKGLPGLVKVFTEGNKDVSTSSPDEEAQLTKLSQWVLEQSHQYLRFPANAILSYTIGPKIDPSADRLSSVRTELLYAAGLPDFAAIHAGLAAAASSTSVTAMRQAIAGIRGASASQVSFLSAMEFTLSF